MSYGENSALAYVVTGINRKKKREYRNKEKDGKMHIQLKKQNFQQIHSRQNPWQNNTLLDDTSIKKFTLKDMYLCSHNM